MIPANNTGCHKGQCGNNNSNPCAPFFLRVLVHIYIIAINSGIFYATINLILISFYFNITHILNKNNH